MGDLVVPFLQAQEYFLKKVPVDTNRWDDISAEAHDMAAVVAGAHGEVLKKIVDAIEKSVVKGEKKLDFAKKFDKIVEETGWSYRGTRNFRINAIWDTNVRQAYNAGREAQMADPELRKKRPFGLYRHGGSETPRIEHKAWDGMVVRLDEPWWIPRSPQNGHGCQCKKFMLSERDVLKRGLKVTAGADMPYSGTYEYTDSQGKKHTLPEGVQYGFDTMPGGYESVRKNYDRLQARIAEYPKPLKEAMVKNYDFFSSPQLAEKFNPQKLEDLTPLLSDLQKIYGDYLPYKISGVAEIKGVEIINKNGKFFVGGEVKDALLRAVNNVAALSEDDERVLHYFWHSIVNKESNDIAGKILGSMFSRFSYPRFIKALGGKAKKNKAVLNYGFIEQDVVDNFLKILRRLYILEPTDLAAGIEVLFLNSASVADIADFLGAKGFRTKVNRQKILAALNAIDSDEFDKFLKEIK